MRVRSTCAVDYSKLGIATRDLDKLKPLRESDVLYSWHYWLHNEQVSEPESDYGLDVIGTHGYIVYRSLLLERNLNPSSCEMVMVEPGHICLDNRRLTEIRGSVDVPLMTGKPRYREYLKAPAKLKSRDHTGRIDLSWVVAEGDTSVNLEMALEGKSSGITASLSLYQIAKLSWNLEYGDQLLGCTHGTDRVGEVFDGEDIEVVSAGDLNELNASKADLEWKPLLLLSANNNDLGQIACLLSAPPDLRGMIRTQACLRCCVTEFFKKGLNFLID